MADMGARESAGAPPPPSSPVPQFPGGGAKPNAYDCDVGWILWLIGLSISLIGIGFDFAEYEGWVARIVAEEATAAAGWSGMATDLYNIEHNGGDWGASLVDIGDFIWNLLTKLVLPALGFWGGLKLAAKFAEWAGSGLAGLLIDIGWAMAGALYGLYELHHHDCW